jgi:hypothetical protein
MNCKDALKLIHEVLDGTASADARARLGEHLESCPACAAEYERFARWEALLREPDPEEPTDAHFDAMARAVGAEVRRRERKPAPAFAPSWRLSWGMAAACLLIGLSVGHLALPRTLTRTETIVQREQAAGPVREVPVERVVYKEVEVPVEVVRTVVKRVPVATPALVAETRLAPTVPAPAATPVAEHVTTHPATGSGIGASPTHEALSGAYTVAYASYRPSRVSPGDLRLIASRLRSDLSTVDEDLGAPALAATLVSDMSAAGAAVDRSLRTAPATAPVEGTR